MGRRCWSLSRVLHSSVDYHVGRVFSEFHESLFSLSDGFIPFLVRSTEFTQLF
jgi:hypothetical protein